MHRSNRTLFVLVTLIGASSLAVAQGSSTALARGHNKFLGSAYSNPQANGFATYFNQVTPENAAKWGSVEGTRNAMNWTELDTAYQFAKDHGLPFKLHTLIWGSQQPGWIDALSPTEQLAEIKEWMSLLAARYPEVDLIDVVNEPLHSPPNGTFGYGASTPFANYINALGGVGTTGWDWVLASFRLARQYFPHATLLINEYNVTNNTGEMQKYIGLVNLLKAEHLIDGVGVQAHYFSTTIAYVPTATTKSNLEALAAVGLPIYATELDIDGVTPNTTTQDDQQQLREYQRLFPMFWENPAVAGVTLWGFRPGMWRGKGDDKDKERAYLVLDNGTERPALQWLRTYLADLKPTFSANPQSQTVTLNGSVTLTAAANGTVAPTLQWQRSGADVAGATAASLTVNSVKPADTGLYAAVAKTVSASVPSKPAIVGIKLADSDPQVAGSAYVYQQNVLHPNTNRYDLIPLDGGAGAFRARYSATISETRAVRMSFIDMDDDIVQLEFSGHGTVSVVLAGASGPALPVNYNQDFKYWKGNAGVVITGADETTNVSAFTVGRATAFDPHAGGYDILKDPDPVTNDPSKNGSSLFVGHETTNYDGIADLAFIAISSANGRFGGIRMANVSFSADSGFTGVYAPGVALDGPLYVGDIVAFGSATPVLQVGSVSNAKITGGDLRQENHKAVQVSGLTKLVFADGRASTGELLKAQSNRAILERDGVDVTAATVVNP